MARWWFLRVLLNSSSFSATLLSISWRTWLSSSWDLRTLFSSCSRAPSASSRAAWSSSFSCSRPYSPPAQEHLQLPQEQPGVLPSLAQDLILLLLKSTFSFLKSSLEFFLLLLKTSALLVQVMDRAASISKLVKKILDFISKVLVLTLDNVKLFKSLILSRLQAEELRAVVAALILGGINFSSNISSLSLPFTKDLVKVLASLLSNQGSSMNTFILHSNLIKVSS